MLKTCVFIFILFLLITACAPSTIGIDNSENTTTPVPGATISSTRMLMPTLTTPATEMPTSLCADIAPPLATTSLELFGTINSIGITISVDPNGDPDQNAVALVEYRTDNNPYHAGFPLSRVGPDCFVGSLFWLEPGTKYDVRITFVDKDGILDSTTLEGSAYTQPEIHIPKPVKSFYVSPNGSGKICSIDVPCSLVSALNRAGPGDAVVLRGGVYYQGDKRLPVSGKEDAPIMIQSYASETAILDGAYPTNFTWSNMGDGVYRTTVQTTGVNLVLADEKRLYPYQNIKDLQALSWGISGFYTEGTNLYVHLENDTDPSKSAIIISRYSSAFLLDGRNYIYILNLTFRHYGKDYGRAIYLGDASNNLIKGNKFTINNLGIEIQNGSNHNIIQDNEFHDTIYEWAWDAVKAIAQTSLEGGGIRFADLTSSQINGISRGNIIRHNIFHDLFDGYGVCPRGTNAQHTNETDVYENLVYNVGDDGMETDGYCSNVRIWGNTFREALIGISLAPARIGPVYAIRNLFYRIGREKGCPFNGHLGPCGGSAFKFDTELLSSGPMYLFHNTFDSNFLAEGGLFISKPASWSILVSRNNIWSVSCSPISDYTNSLKDFDYDALWTSGNCHVVIWNGVRYKTLEQFSRATGQEPHGLNVSPEFVDWTTGNYQLSPDSQLIDAGVFIPGINDNFNGSAPDIGAFEYGK